MVTPFPNYSPNGTATPAQMRRPFSPGFALGRLWQKVNNTVRITGKSKAAATAAFLGDSGSLESKESECCKTTTDLAV